MTPCYSNVTTPYVPARTTAISNGRMASGAQFALSFPLVDEVESKAPRLGPILGGTFGGLVLILILLVVVCWRCRRNAQHQTPQEDGSVMRSRTSILSPTSLLSATRPSTTSNNPVTHAMSPGHYPSSADAAGSGREFIWSPPGSPMVHQAGMPGSTGDPQSALSPIPLCEMEGNMRPEQYPMDKHPPPAATDHPAFQQQGQPPEYEKTTPISPDLPRQSMLVKPLFSK